MTTLPAELRELIESGPLAHVSTVNADGSPQVSMVWIALDGGELVTAHLGRYAKIRNLERDPRVVISFLGPATPGELMRPYATITGRARLEWGDAAWPLLNRMTKVYVGPDETFPAPEQDGYVVRYDIDKIGGIGPWAPGSH